MIGADGHVYRDKPLPEPDEEFLESIRNTPELADVILIDESENITHER